jgi:predicted O-methyltransferase YrrM
MTVSSRIEFDIPGTGYDSGDGHRSNADPPKNGMPATMTSHVTPTPLTPALYDYVLSVSLREPDVLRELRAETAKLPNGEMSIAPEQGPLLAFLIEVLGAKKVIELGTFTGTSTLWMARALPPGGRILACDVSPEYTSTAKRYWDKAGVADRIDLVLQPGLTTLDARLAAGEAGTFDLAFIDADKTNYDGYFERCLKLLRPGGIIAIDNTLWDGKVADPTVTDPDTVAIRNLNAKLFLEERVTLSFLPISDGLTLCRKRG